MSTPKIMSPPRRRLSLLKREAVDEYDTMNKRARIDDTKDENTQAREKDNFMKMCLQVSYEAFQDLRNRFQVLQLPECKNICTHKSKKDKQILPQYHALSLFYLIKCDLDQLYEGNVKQISSTAEGCIKIDQSSHSWFDALEVCVMCIMNGQCLSGSVLKNIVEIILNAHEDVKSGYTVDYILRQCQYTLLLNFSMHPPCYESYTRECYKDFLLSAMDEKKENRFTNRKEHSSDNGIVAHCLDRLMYEISMDSKDGILVEKGNLTEIKEGIQGMHWKKENMELFEFLERPERIDRLMMVLESTIQLIQADLALWHRGYHSESRGKKRCQKPIITYLLWQTTNNNVSERNKTNFNFGTVSLLCYQIMKLFAYFIHLQYPEEHITTMSLWMNAVVQILYIYENFLKIDYPSPSMLCIRFSQEFCDIITPLPSHSVLRILQRLQPTFMRHLVGECYIKSLPHTPDKDITNVIKSCVEDAIWKKFPGDSVCVAPEIAKNCKIKICPLLNSQSKKCKSCKSFNLKSPVTTTDESTNLYPKLELNNKVGKNKIQRIFFVNVLFITFIAYLETYNIRDFRHRLQTSNTENKNEFDPELTKDYNITPPFVKKYTSIISALKMLFQLLDGREDKFSLTLLDILKNYLS